VPKLSSLPQVLQILKAFDDCPDKARIRAAWLEARGKTYAAYTNLNVFGRHTNTSSTEPGDDYGIFVNPDAEQEAVVNGLDDSKAFAMMSTALGLEAKEFMRMENVKLYRIFLSSRRLEDVREQLMQCNSKQSASSSKKVKTPTPDSVKKLGEILYLIHKGLHELIVMCGGVQAYMEPILRSHACYSDVINKAIADNLHHIQCAAPNRTAADSILEYV
jgi:hypothetical protein